MAQLHGILLGCYINRTAVQRIQSKYLRSITQVPRGISNAALRLELGRKQDLDGCL